MNHWLAEALICFVIATLLVFPAVRLAVWFGRRRDQQDAQLKELHDRQRAILKALEDRSRRPAA